MGILDLSLVTQSLINLLTYYFSTADENLVDKPKFSSQRPDLFKETGVDLYLYHVCQDPYFNNRPASEDRSAPVRFSPMGLHLFYQLVTQKVSDPDASDRALLEQNMMGIAMKALHDYSIIDDRTVLTDGLTNKESAVFDKKIKGTGTCLRIELLNIDQKDAISYWATSNAAPRLAAYYKVSVVFLKQEPLPSLTGRVLSYGISAFVGMGPRIDGCSNTLSFKLPSKTEMQTVELHPAQVAFGEIVLFTGSGFDGLETELLLRNVAWDKPLPVDPTWEMKLSEKGATIRVQESITLKDQVDPIPILPGLYSAIIKVKKWMTIPGGPPQEIGQMSNECPFMISPRIDNVPNNIILLPAIPDKTITIEGYIFPVEKTEEPLYPSLRVYFGTRKLTGIKSAHILKNGEFHVIEVVVNPLIDPPTKESQIKLKIPIDIEKDIRYFPLRIIINGAESPPTWIKV